jgi:predicted nucleic acid-binding Zn ribbon protein
MFCDKCGATLQEDQRFCSRCGKEVAGPIMGYPQRNRVREHVRLLGILWLALSALDGLMGVASYIVANTVFNQGTHPERPAFLHPFLSLIATVVIVKAFAGFAVGWGLLQREPWARCRCGARVCFALFQRPIRYCARHLHSVGPASCQVGRRVRERGSKRQRDLSKLRRRDCRATGILSR